MAAWVHGVAALAARKARLARARRNSREGRAAHETEPVAPEVATDPDLARLLDEEIGRLPDRYRLPVVLCAVRELTVAGAELGWPVSTVASRLSRGRQLLAARLERRGVTCATAAVGLGATANVTATSVPARLLGDTESG